MAGWKPALLIGERIYIGERMYIGEMIYPVGQASCLAWNGRLEAGPTGGNVDGG